MFSDEVYEHILFDDSEHHSIISCPGMDKVTILLNRASKGFSWTETRIGWVPLPTVEEAELFTNLNINYFSCIPSYNQEEARIALVSPRSQDSVRHMVTVFQERRDLVVNGLNAIKGISCQKPKGTFYVFPNISEVCENLGIMDMFRSLPPDLKGETSPSTLLQMFLLFEYQVATMDRKSFGRIRAENFHYLRLSFATDTESLKEGLRRISAASEDTERFRYFFNRGEHLSCKRHNSLTRKRSNGSFATQREVIGFMWFIRFIWLISFISFTGVIGS